MAATDESQVGHDISEQGSNMKPDAEEYESKHVHEVYQQIASHFSETRYKVRLYYRTCQCNQVSDDLAMANRRTVPSRAKARLNRS